MGRLLSPLTEMMWRSWTFQTSWFPSSRLGLVTPNPCTSVWISAALDRFGGGCAETCGSASWFPADCLSFTVTKLVLRPSTSLRPIKTVLSFRASIYHSHPLQWVSLSLLLPVHENSRNDGKMVKRPCKGSFLRENVLRKVWFNFFSQMWKTTGSEAETKNLTWTKTCLCRAHSTDADEWYLTCDTYFY